MNPDKPPEHGKDDGNQGEGDRISARRHDRHVREFVAGGKVDPAGVRDPHPTKVTIEELVAKGRTFVDRVEALVHRVADRIGRRSHR
ncbi:MAG: hypothetical protein E6J90_26240 [Deltaproteobacteria bacterium]|nr:MAG: hypothetical protein E6J90_26240 [Deltaproteobacteria bacterium]TMQ18769.1 MAG: hypothetical protein E6J91_07440 [Deltaproteobacteria bacterium]